MLKLEFEDQSQTSFWIVDDEFSIGSSSKNQLVIDRKGIEPMHARVTNMGNNIYIEPLGELTNLSVNHVPIYARSVLKVNDVIMLAGVVMRLVDPSVRQRNTGDAAHRNVNSHAQLHSSTHNSAEQTKRHAKEQVWKIKALVASAHDTLIDIDERLSVGRDSSNDLVIAGTHISRRHAELFIANGQLIVRDLDSSNGTSVNGEPIRERAVYLNDEIAFDSTVYRVAVGKAPNSITEDSLDKTQFRPALTEQLLALEDDTRSVPAIKPLELSESEPQPTPQKHDDHARYSETNEQKSPIKTYMIAASILMVLALIAFAILII